MQCNIPGSWYFVIICNTDRREVRVYLKALALFWPLVMGRPFFIHDYANIRVISSPLKDTLIESTDIICVNNTLLPCISNTRIGVITCIQSILARNSFITSTRSQAVARIADRILPHSTFGGHVTSSATWPFDTPCHFLTGTKSNGFRDIQRRM